MKDETQYANLIPNLSIKSNEELFNMFLLGKNSFDKFYCKLAEKEKRKYLSVANGQAADLDIQDLFLPMAVWTSRLNERIRTQNGCFVAYNLYSPPMCDEKGEVIQCQLPDTAFEYLTLDHIQERLIGEKAIFYYKIEIDQKCCKAVVDWLKACGISRKNVYPELDIKKI